MAAGLSGDAAQSGSVPQAAKLEEPDHSSSNWYFSREEIEKRSPSRLDGIDLKKETYFRKSYCTFLQDLGMQLKVPQVTIATAIVFSHRFFLRQSHLKNDRHMIATICMFLAGKVEETPRPIRDVIYMSYEIRHKKDPTLTARIKQKEVYEEQKELVLVGERLVLTTLGFDLNIHHPYKPLVASIKKLKVAQNALAQVAWNFVNDGLRTSLCLQFKPHHIAAGAIFLAAKFLKVRLPTEGEGDKIVWWQEFGVTPRQLEEVSNQMLELYEQNKTPGPTPNGPRSTDPGSSGGGPNRPKGSDGAPLANGHHWSHMPNSGGVDKADKHAQTVKTEDAVTSGRKDEEYDVSGAHPPTFAYGKKENGHLEGDYEPTLENGSMPAPPDDNGRTVKAVSNGQVTRVVKEERKEQVAVSSFSEDGQVREEHFREKKMTDVRVIRNSRVKTEVEDGKYGMPDTREMTEAKSSVEEREAGAGDVVDSKPGLESNPPSSKVKVENGDEEPKKIWSTNIEDVNTDRVKALAQKRRKSKGEGLDAKPPAVKLELTDEEELLERELESGVEAEAEKVKQERRDVVKSKPSQKAEHDVYGKRDGGVEDGEFGPKRRRFHDEDGGANEKKRTKSSERVDRAEWTDGELDRSRAGGMPADRTTEEGEFPGSSHGHDQPRSPRQLESSRRPILSGSHDKSGSPSSKRHRDVHGRSRDGHRDGRVGYGSRERDYHQRDHHHQHRPDGDRDRHYHDRDHKKLRTYELHGS